MLENRPVLEISQLEAAAAKIADDAIRLGNRGGNRQANQARFLGAAQDPNVGAEPLPTELTKSPPSTASRTAAVAIKSSRTTSMASARAMKRRIVVSARFTPSGLRRPVLSKDLASPHWTLSLNNETGDRVRESNTTRRTELDPMSMTPTRP